MAKPGNGEQLLGFLYDVPLLPLEACLEDLVDRALPTLGYLPIPTTVWTHKQVEELIEAANERVQMANNFHPQLSFEQKLAVAAFDVKLPEHFPLCVALSAAFSGDEPVRIQRLAPWRNFMALFHSAMLCLERPDMANFRVARRLEGQNGASSTLSCSRDIAVSHEYVRDVLPRKYEVGSTTTLWNPTSVSLGIDKEDWKDDWLLKAGFAWLDHVAAQKPVLVRFHLHGANPRGTMRLWLWSRREIDEYILVPPVRLHVKSVEDFSLGRAKVRFDRAILITADVLPQPFRYDDPPRVPLLKSLALGDGPGVHTHTSRTLANLTKELSRVEYRGVVAMVAGYTPERTCKDHMLADLPPVLKGLGDIALITAEAVRIAESRLQRLPAGVAKLAFDEAVAVAAYTYDLGMSSTNDGQDNLFFVLNNVLRERLPKKMIQIKPFLTYLMRGLTALPVVSGLVYRGVPAATRATIEEHYRLSTDVHWSAFTSTTLNLDSAREFAEAPGGVIFRLTLLNGGRCSRAYSAFPTEDEVLVSPNARFIVTAECRVDLADGYYYVDMLERTGDGYVF